MFIPFSASRNGLDYWLAYWMNEVGELTASFTYVGAASQPLIGSFNALVTVVANNISADFAAHQPGSSHFYVSIYAGIIAANLIFTTFRALLFAIAGLAAASAIHKRMLDSTLLASLVFVPFEYHPRQLGIYDESCNDKNNFYAMKMKLKRMPTFQIKYLTVRVSWQTVSSTFEHARLDVRVHLFIGKLLS